MKLILASLFCSIILASVCQAKVRYDHYHVYRVHFNTDDQFNYLFQMDMGSTEVDFWQLSHSQHYADVMVAPQKAEAFLNDLKSHGLQYEITIEDVQKLIDAERM